jgi:hypothetical protein
MMSLNAERIWTIMFTIPLPLMLGGGAMVHEMALETKPIMIATEMAVETLRAEAPHHNGLPEVAFIDPRTESVWGNADATLDKGAAVRGDIAADELLVLRCAESDCLQQDLATAGVVSNVELLFVTAPAASHRRDEFVNFDSQAPPPTSRVFVDAPYAHRAAHSAQRKSHHRIHPFETGQSILTWRTHLYSSGKSETAKALSAAKQPIGFSRSLVTRAFNSAAIGPRTNTSAASSSVMPLLNGRARGMSDVNICFDRINRIRRNENADSKRRSILDNTLHYTAAVVA